MNGNVKEHKICKSPKRKRPQSSGGLPTKRTKTKKVLEYQATVKKRSVALILNIVQNKLKRLISNVTDHSPDQI